VVRPLVRSEPRLKLNVGVWAATCQLLRGWELLRRIPDDLVSATGEGLPYTTVLSSGVGMSFSESLKDIGPALRTPW